MSRLPLTARSIGWLVFLVIAVAGAVVDLATKAAAFANLGMPGEGRRLILVPGTFVLETNLNEGALFGMGQGLSALFAAVSVAALAGIAAMLARPAVYEDRWLVVALGLIVGGIVGNLVDRLGVPGLKWHTPPERIGQPVYAVRDWIHVTVPGVIDWPIFNLADSWLVIGAGLLFVLSLRSQSPPSAASVTAPTSAIHGDTTIPSPARSPAHSPPAGRHDQP